MKKTLILIFAAGLLSLSVFAQKTTKYTLTRGDKDPKEITWTITNKGQGLDWHLTSGDNIVEYYTINENGETTLWRHIDTDTDSDFTVERSGNEYSVTGKVKGKKVDRKEKSKGNPWFQNIELNVMAHLNGSEPFQFECVRPTEADIHVMIAENKGEVDIEGFKAYHIRATVGGFFSGVWGCSYYFDTKTNEFVVYKAVEGGPGTPETKIVKKK